MKIINVIPPNVPTSKRNQQLFENRTSYKFFPKKYKATKNSECQKSIYA